MADTPRRFLIDLDRLPKQYPTHLQSPQFWEALGRTVATFGFLEETLGKAIFAITGTREITDQDVEAAVKKWGLTLEGALSNPLGSLIDLYGKALREHPKKSIENAEDLINALREAATLRNVICHGSWHAPDASGRSTPYFFNKKLEKFETPVDVPYLEQAQRHVIELACGVIDTVTMMGWQFPGSGGPGIPIMKGRYLQHDQ